MVSLYRRRSYADTRVAIHEVLFTCGNKGMFREPSPRVGDVLYCYGCEEFQEVIDSKRKEKP